MSRRDPFLDLAEAVLENLSDWWTEITLAEPRVVARPVKWQLENPPPSHDGPPANPVEAFAARREDLLAALRPIRRRVKKLKARLREVYRLRYGEGFSYAKIAAELVPQAGVRSVERYVEQIRACVAGTLRRQKPERLEVLWQLVHAQSRREKDPK